MKLGAEHSFPHHIYVTIIITLWVHRRLRTFMANFLDKQTVTLRKRSVITSHMKQWIKVLISALIPFYHCPMMTSSNGNISHVTGPLCGKFTGQQLTSQQCNPDIGENKLERMILSDAKPEMKYPGDHSFQRGRSWITQYQYVILFVLYILPWNGNGTWRLFYLPAIL